MQWSIRARDLITDIIPDEIQKLKVSGAISFDRYKIYHFRTKQEWMDKYSYNYCKMVGYAGWAFDKLYREPTSSEMKRRYGSIWIDKFCQAHIRINEILRTLIINNPDTLFLLKEHPGVVQTKYSELFSLTDYPNVLYFRNEEAIADCINGCDIWMGFESTTCLEAWLLNKPTLLINPTGKDFIRSNLHHGSPIYASYKEVQTAIDEFYQAGKIADFDSKIDVHHSIITDTIQWADGKNHLRAAYYIEQFLNQYDNKPLNITLMDKIHTIFETLLYEISPLFSTLPKFRNLVKGHRLFSQSELNELYKRYGACIDKFHKKHQLTDGDIAQLDSINNLAI